MMKAEEIRNNDKLFEKKRVQYYDIDNNNNSNKKLENLNLLKIEIHCSR